LGDDALEARIENNLGNAKSAQWAFVEAEQVYRSALEHARRAEDSGLEIDILLNLARTAAQTGQDEQTHLRKASESLKHLPASYQKAFAQIALGRLLLESLNRQGAPSELLLAVNAGLRDADRLAASLGNPRLQSYAEGYRAQLYEFEQRYPEAQKLTLGALYHAQQAGAPESLYLWQWQHGRLLAKQKQRDPAIAEYRQAVETLKIVKRDLSRGLRHAPDSFRELIGSVYYELADLFLQKARLSSGEPKSALLIEARNTIEMLKSTEIQELFQDECVITLRAKETALDRIAKDTAVFYPVLLEDRTEIILTLPEGNRQFTVPVTRPEIESEALRLREQLENRRISAYLPPAQRLYRWLIEPIRAALSESHITNLVIVPDGELRTIPLAALHDGKRFLIETVAVATTPGLSLTDPKSISRDRVSLLAGGISEAVQGFSALPNVTRELDSIQGAFPGEILLNDTYTVNQVTESMREQSFSIMHIASHGQFNRDPNQTFVLAYDDKLTLNRLEDLIGIGRFREQPLELLTLSACQTAVGDDRAALGLAGIALKAGARSALATLWFIDDEATSVLVGEFYRQLKQPELSKAQALQNAQKKLIGDPGMNHPALWAPFILIGNWL
jgi:CHAT domain-containing protein